MRNMYGRLLMLVLCITISISFAFPLNVFATSGELNGESEDVGFVEKTFIILINKIASALDIEDFSIDSLIYGKSNGRGMPSSWQKSPYAFNPGTGNIFYNIYAYSYGVFRNIGVIIINLSITFLAIKGLYSDAGSKDYFKSGIMTLIGTSMLFLTLPGILDYVLMLRETLLDVIYSISTALNAGLDGAFIEGLRQNASSTTATIKDSLFYLAGVILSLYFIFIYVSMGISFVLCMWLSPVLITTSLNKSKQKLEFFKYVAGLLITPVIDAALLILPLVMVSKSEQTLVTIATFASIIPTRTWLRKQLGVGTGISEMMGAGFAIMGAQMAGSTVGGVIGTGKKLSQGVEHIQKSNMFSELSDIEKGKSTSTFENLGSESMGASFANAEKTMSGSNSQSNYSSFTRMGQAFAGEGTTSANTVNNNGSYNNNEQSAEEAAIVAKYGNKAWFKESGIRMTNEQRAQAEATNAFKSFGSAAGGLGGRVVGMGVGATILSGYGLEGTVIGARIGGDIGDAIGSRVGERRGSFISSKFTRLPNISQYSVDENQYGLPGSEFSKIDMEDRTMVEHNNPDLIDYNERPFVSVGGGGGLSTPAGNETIEMQLMAGYEEFKSSNYQNLQNDYNHNVPEYARSVMDSNKDVLLESALESYANKNNIDKDSPVFTSPQMRVNIHETVKSEVANGLTMGAKSEQFRDDFAKYTHTQVMSVHLTGESAERAQQLSVKQLNEFSGNINNHIEESYANSVNSYLDNYIKNNSNKLVDKDGAKII